jgi:pimeloyl-ACP methyl ester carboxylesterase
VEDYTADLERLREAIGLDRMDLLGHSFGGLVAASYAAAHPDRVRRLIVDGIPNWLEKERIASLELPLEIVSICEPENVASIRVMERLGMIHDRDTKHPKLGVPLRVFKLRREERSAPNAGTAGPPGRRSVATFGWD